MATKSIKSNQVGTERKPAKSVSAPKTDKISPLAKTKPSSKSASLSVGSKAPAFSLLDDTDRRVSLSDFAGKFLILYFYPKDSTPGCTQESCDFRDNLNRLTTAGAAVVGLSADSVASHKKFKAKYELNFPLLSDPDHEALQAYGVWQEKSLYGRTFMGIVRSTFVIDGGGMIRAVFPKVSVAGHVDQVLAAVKELRKSKAGAKA